MAANDLCEILLKEGEKIESDTQQKICNVFIKHLDDQSTTIQGNISSLFLLIYVGNAVKCLN